MLGRMGLTKSVLAGGLALGLSAGWANAGILAGWTFETNTPADLSNSVTGPSVTAETGSGTLLGVHASTATDWSTPAGNGSDNSYSVNTWAIGDYFQFSTSTLGASAIVVAFDQTSSNTGPKNFKLQYSTDGSGFTDSSSYVVLPNGGSPNFSWSTAAGVQSAYSYSFDLSSITALDNQATVYFRLTLVDTAPANTGSTFGAGGTDRIDNVTVSSVPEPASLGLLALGGGMILVRRRRQA